MRTMILNAACSFGHEKSIEKAKKLFTEYLNRYKINTTYFE